MKKKLSSKKLPKMYRGAEVVRGQPMHSGKLDKFLEQNALDGFDAARDMWVVVEDGALEDLDNTVELKGFASKEDALIYARARSNGNVDHRILCVTKQILVVATMNDL